MTITEKLAYILDHGFILSRTSTFTVINTFNDNISKATNADLTDYIDSLAWQPQSQAALQKRLYQLQLHTKDSTKALSYNSQWFFKQSLHSEINKAYNFLKQYYND